MIVDDDRAFVEALAIYLEDHGYRVAKTYCGREGVVELMRQRFDLAIVDLHLPDMEGTEVAAELQRWQPSTQVLLISSDDSPETTRRCNAGNAHRFLLKPLGPDDLLETISRALVDEQRQSQYATP
jgi:DNA-binding NtrC family response regulator